MAAHNTSQARLGVTKMAGGPVSWSFGYSVRGRMGPRLMAVLLSQLLCKAGMSLRVMPGITRAGGRSKSGGIDFITVRGEVVGGAIAKPRARYLVWLIDGPSGAFLQHLAGTYR